MNKCVIFVHPIMSVETNFRVCRNLGYKIFTIATDIEQSKISVENLSKISDFIYKSSACVEDNINKIKDFIEKNNLEVFAIINGIDASLYYADYLYNQLIGDISLDLEYSKARMNKYKTNKILAKNNIKIIPSLEVTGYDDLITKKDMILDLKWPIIAKPSEGTAAMAGFQVIKSFDELEKYIKHNLGNKNAYYDTVINSIMVQTYLPVDKYDEFMIDFCCYNESKILNGISYYTKQHIKDNIYIEKDISPVLPSEIQNIQPVIEYVKNILCALKVKYGYTHNEVFWDRKDDFYLIESNNRLAGSGLNESYAYVYNKPMLPYLFDLIENKNVNLIDKRHGFAKVLFLHNYYLPQFNSLDFTKLSSEITINSMYKTKMISPDFNNYSRAECVAANVVISNRDENAFYTDIEEIYSREKDGTLFLL